MKSFFSYTALFIVLAVSIFSCKKEDNDEVSTGTPVVKYVRITDPKAADSLVVGAFMGSLVAIVGEDLQNTRELWFNDQKANLSPTYITNKTILVNVPSTVPSKVTDKMRFVFKDGSELLYDFKVNVPAPLLSSIKCEYVPDGGVVELEGDFFFEPKVFFTDNLAAEIVSLTKTEMKVKVPAGAKPGPITIQTNFGKIKSRFLFRDNRNIILNYDGKNHETWTAPITAANADPTMPGCDGSYVLFKHNANGAWQWTNELTMQYWATRGRGRVPVATGSLNDLTLKFECNVPQEWKDVRMEMFFGPYADDHGRDAAGTAIARWKPWKNGPFKTNGWVTISIPLTEFKYGKDDSDSDETGTRKIENLSNLTNVVFMLFGPATGANPVKIAVDNIRIVQN
jgi:Surface glycan-binding protein B xyloglucan binding domain